MSEKQGRMTPDDPQWDHSFHAAEDARLGRFIVALAAEAIREDDAGLTISQEDLAAELGITLDAAQADAGAREGQQS